MNSLFNIQNAKVTKVGQYQTGQRTDNNGNAFTWHVLPFVVEYEYSFNDPSAGETHGICTAAVKLRAENAIWAKDNIHSGMLLNLWVRIYGDLRAYNAGGMYREATENNLIADFIQVADAETTNPQPVQP